MKLVISSLALMVLFLAGCETMSVNRYSALAQNVSTLRKLKMGNINVGKFVNKSNAVGVKCRLVPLLTPNNESYEDYIRKALETELIMADKYDEESSISLSGSLDKLELVTFSDSKWEIGITVKSSNGQSLTISETFPFAGGFAADLVCRTAAQSFEPAVQNLITKLIKSPQFVSLL